MNRADSLHLKFAPDAGFRRTLAERVDSDLKASGLARTDAPSFYIKASFLIFWTAASYALLVFAPVSGPQAVALALSLGVSSILMAFNIYHDASHGAASRHALVNRIGMWMMDAAGASSYVWARKHNGMHHVHPNVHGFDCDLDAGPIARFATQQPRLPHHRGQHVYLWFAYGLYAFKWQFYDDFKPLFDGRIGSARFARPKGLDAAQFVAGKLAFLCLAFVVPMARHDALVVIAFYFLVYYVNGLIFVTVVMAAHVSDCTKTVEVRGARAERDWATHQAEVSCDFGHGDRILSWCLGGLNYHIEHHLFPRICHVRYRQIAPIVQRTCAEFGVPYNHKRSFFDAVASHHAQLYTLAKA